MNVQNKERDYAISHNSVAYAQAVVDGQVNAPKYVIAQCRDFLSVAYGLDPEFYLDTARIIP